MHRRGHDYFKAALRNNVREGIYLRSVAGETYLHVFFLASLAAVRTTTRLTMLVIAGITLSKKMAMNSLRSRPHNA